MSGTEEPEFRHASRRPGNPRGLIIVAVLVVVALIAVPLIWNALRSSPEGWLDDHYTYVDGDVDNDGRHYTSDDTVDQTVAAIDQGTDPSEKRQEDSTYFLRYKNDWLVEVEADDDGSGTDVTLFEFDAGYRHHGTLLFFWSSHYQRGGFFRGGGSGSGK
ncbi:MULTISPECIES: DUF4247 domain-containing protein [unclassified Nocardioides]|uniref:DUF4247 domain-containing protein n=1 Tax=unclassified Nocardioides TaxID=2615069 RepID=UPI0006F65069|nr:MULTISPECIES: DUF4247 domain-containing protein [unclassified Nocardioides]KQY56258.1 hypothetical protein ASD30_07835 [Nocardioides sp. Root140]KQZ75042.1 hypothetical protein ASD66_01300 [Nocardioides sp. Root151]KRF10576.1 hypothetical protein ASH02_21035 [Nocardioides sp. Soil796]